MISAAMQRDPRFDPFFRRRPFGSLEEREGVLHAITNLRDGRLMPVRLVANAELYRFAITILCLASIRLRL